MDKSHGWKRKTRKVKKKGGEGRRKKFPTTLDVRKGRVDLQSSI